MQRSLAQYQSSKDAHLHGLHWLIYRHTRFFFLLLWKKEKSSTPLVFKLFQTSTLSKIQIDRVPPPNLTPYEYLYTRTLV